MFEITHASGLLAVTLAGLVLGLQHTFEPDHLAAAGNLIAYQERWWGGAKQGLIWGIAHMAVLFPVGVLAILLRTHVPAWMDWIDLAVGIGLVINGIFCLQVLRKGHFHVVWHEGRPSVMFHAHDLRWDSLPQDQLPIQRGSLLRRYVPGSDTAEDPYADNEVIKLADVHRHGRQQVQDTVIPLSSALGWGLLQGLAGSGAVTVMAMSAVADTQQAIAFLGSFSLGTVAGMGLLGAFAGLLISRAITWGQSLQVWMKLASAAFSIIFGASMIYGFTLA